MSINQDRDSILNALNAHFGGHRINYLTLHDYLCNECSIDGHAIHQLLDDLTNSGHIICIPTTPTPEYQISPKGKGIVEAGGFVKNANQSTSQHIVINNSGNISNSVVGNQARDFKLRSLPTSAQEIPTISTNNPLPTVKSKGWFNKLCIWCINNIWMLILSVIGSVISYFYTKGK